MIYAQKIKRIFNRSSLNVLAELFRANLKARDHNSVLGILWSLISPLALLLVMYLIFRYKFGSNITAYPLHLFIGIVFINFFLTVTGYSLAIFSSYRDFTLNSTVPRELLIFSNVAIHGYKFVVEILVCTILSISLGLFSLKSFFLLVPLILSFFLMVIGTVFILSIIYCFARDIAHIWGLVSRLLFFATPVFYSLDSLKPLTKKVIFYGNPVAPFLVSFQNLFLSSGNINVAAYCYSFFLSLVFFAVGYGVFIKFEYSAVERA